MKIVAGPRLGASCASALTHRGVHAAHLAPVADPLAVERVPCDVGVPAGRCEGAPLSDLGGQQLVAPGSEQLVAEEHRRVDHGQQRLVGAVADLPQLPLAELLSVLQVYQRNQEGPQARVARREHAVLLVAERAGRLHGLEDAVAREAVQVAVVLLNPSQAEEQEVQQLFVGTRVHCGSDRRRYEDE